MSDPVSAAKRTLVDAGLVLDAAGLGEYTRGHVSVRHPDEPAHFLMKPHSIGFEEMTAESIVTCTMDGGKIAGSGRRHSEVFIHSEILRARPELHSVIHAHPKFATVFAAAARPWRIVSQACANFADGVGYFDATIDLIRASETGAGVAAAMAGTRTVLMRAHGVAVAGASVPEAVMRLLALERACEDQWIAAGFAAGFGGAPHEFDAADIERLRRNLDRAEQYQVNFDYLVRRARRAAQGGFAST